MGLTIIGCGLSGMVAAIYAKKLCPSGDVIVIDNQNASNTRIAGQRYRTRFNGLAPLDMPDMTAQFPGSDPSRAEQFFKKGREIVQELQNLSIQSSFLPWRDSSSWFGPQLGEASNSGKGSGASVLRLLKSCATSLGVRFISGNAQEVLCDDNREITAIQVRTRNGDVLQLKTRAYIIACGSPAGSLFHSTNVPNDGKLICNLLDIGVSTVDEHIFMLHMAGRCSATGESSVGCIETDLLAGYQAFFRDEDGLFTRADEYITTLLLKHRAHDLFKSICLHIITNGGVVKYEKSGDIQFGRVSHHYSHFGILTEDGVTVKGLNNAYVVGEISGIGYWLGKCERLPGTGLVHCLITGELAARRAAERGYAFGKASIVCCAPPEQVAPNLVSSEIKSINTNGLYAHYQHDNRGVKNWLTSIDNKLATMPPSHQLRLSKYIAVRCANKCAKR